MGIRLRLMIGTLVLSLGVLGTTGSAQSGPFSAQIQRALRALGFNLSTGSLTLTTGTLTVGTTAISPTLAAFTTNTTIAGNLRVSSYILFGDANSVGATTHAQLVDPGVDGQWALTSNNGSIGSRLKFDALPTIASGFGGSPSVVAGSVPMDGSVNVGTGGVATTGVITFNGAAFPSAPNCVYSTTTTNAVTRGTPTTTQLTLNSTTAWLANDIVTWHCFSAK
jgi:hypothetical protein